MENYKSYIDEIVHEIEQEACYSNPGPAAVKVGEYIDSNFYLIRKSDFPCSVSTVGVLYVEGRPDIQGTRRRGLELLARAEQLSQQERAKKQEWQDDKYEAYISLLDSSERISRKDYDLVQGALSRFDHKALDEIVRLKRQLDS